MSATGMVAAVNRLVGELLAGSGEVFLPGIGSLYVERRAARRISKRSIEPPCRVVSFTSEQRGESLVDEIARAAQCDAAKAQEIYDRWIVRVQEPDMLTVEGVGVLKFKSFIPDTAFDRRINPQGHKPVRVQASRVDWVLWVGICAIVFVIASPAVIWWMDYRGLRPAVSEEQISETVSVTMTPAVAQTDGFDLTDSLTQARADANVGAEPAPQPVEQAEPESVPAPVSAKVAETAAPHSSGSAPAEMVSGLRYVVLGVFSTVENAARAVGDAAKKDAAMRCGVYRFGAKFMVSPFQSADAEACTQFIRQSAAAFPGMWTYTAK